MDSFLIRGVNHNVNFLRDTFVHPRFLSGDISTKFIPQEYPNGYSGHVLTDYEKQHVFALAGALHHLRVTRDSSISSPDFEQQVGPGEYVISLKGEKVNVGVVATRFTEQDGGDKTFDVHFSSKEDPIRVDLENYATDDLVIPADIGGEAVTAQLFKVRDLGYDLQYHGTVFSVDVLTPLEAELSAFMKEPVKRDTANFVMSPMAGTLISVAVKKGDRVVVGQEIAIVEAMKMQNILRATRDGIVKEVKVEAGKPLQLEEIIVELEPVQKA